MLCLPFWDSASFVYFLFSPLSFNFSGLLKSCGLQADGRIDDRSFWINYVSHLSTHLTIPLVYPRMMAIHNLDEKV